ncbi:hypothetical protein D3C83_312280 [compost metagenome]
MGLRELNRHLGTIAQDDAVVGIVSLHKVTGASDCRGIQNVEQHVRLQGEWILFCRLVKATLE